MSGLPAIDLVVLTILAAAAGRGLWIGLIREGLSIVSIGAATIVTRLFAIPLSIRITEWSADEITGRAALWIAGMVLVVVTILVVGTLARSLRRGAQFAGLGWADRMGGGALGLAEGTVLSTVLVLIALWLVGPDHPTLVDSRSVAAVEQIRALQAEGSLPQVSSRGLGR